MTDERGDADGNDDALYEEDPEPVTDADMKDDQYVERNEQGEVTFLDPAAPGQDDDPDQTQPEDPDDYAWVKRLWDEGHIKEER